MVRVSVVKARPIPAHGLVVEATPGIEIDGRRVVALVRRVTEKPLDLRWRAALVAGAAADERLADIAAEIDRLVLPARLGDMEDEQRLAVFLDQPCLRRDDAAQLLVGTQHAEEVVLDLVHLQDADDLEAAPSVPNAEDQPAAFRVREGGDRLIGGSGNVAARLLELDVGPLVALQAFDELRPLHRRLLQHQPDLVRLLAPGEAVQVAIEALLHLGRARG